MFKTKEVNRRRDNESEAAPDERLVGVLDEEVLALVKLHADLDEALEDAPHVVHVQVDLRGELLGLVPLDAQDHVVVVVARGHARDEPELHLQKDRREGCVTCILASSIYCKERVCQLVRRRTSVRLTASPVLLE